MSDLLNDAEGRLVVLEAQRDLLRRRLSRFFKRNLVIDFEQWDTGGEFDLFTLLGQLNAEWDDELRDLWRLLGHVGGLRQTVWDEVIYVDPTGSDITGTGSDDNPYASLWFLGTLPRVIRNHVSVVLRGDVDYGDVLTLCHQFEEDGCLSIVGNGPAVDPYNHVLDGVLNAHTAERNTWNFCTLSVNPTTACYKYFWRLQSGAAQDNAAPICTADVPAGRIWVRFIPTAGIANGDEYTFAIPARTLTIEGASITAIDGHNSSDVSSLPAVSRINFVNLNIDLNPSPDRERTLVCEGAPMGFWFTRILAPDNEHSTGPDIVFRNEINNHNPATHSSSLESEANSGIDNLFLSAGETAQSAGLMVVNREVDLRHEYNDPVIVLESDAKIKCVDCMSRWEINNANVRLEQCSARQFLILNSTFWSNYCAAVAEYTDTNIPDLYAELSRVSFNTGLFGISDIAITLVSSFLKFLNSGGDTAGAISAYDYCVDLSGISNMFMHNAWLGTAPTINDIIFSDPAAPIAAAFPGIDAVATDAILNNVMRT